MSYDAYDIKIWHKSIWSILVSKRPSGPQQPHPFIRFWLKICLKIRKLTNASEMFSVYKFWKSFVFSAKLKVHFWTSKQPRIKKLFCKMFLKSNFTFKYIWGEILSISQESHCALMETYDWMQLHKKFMKTILLYIFGIGPNEYQNSTV